jgi:predicted RNA-binding Zn-ribbon protein involved in translation (DUF1610 family)
MRLVELKCGTCGVKFMPKSERQRYCCRSCFKKAFYHRKRAEELNRQKAPNFRCPLCDQYIILPFDPVENAELWTQYKCPGCFALIISVSENISAKDSGMV